LPPFLSYRLPIQGDVINLPPKENLFRGCLDKYAKGHCGHILSFTVTPSAGAM
jgi:hypothetical protein